MWEPFFDRMVRKIIQRGALTVTYPSGKSKVYGDGSGDPAHLIIHDERALYRIPLNPELALGECYMNQQISFENDDLRGFLAIALKNIGIGRRTGIHLSLGRFRKVVRAVRQWNPMHTARRNVAHHYDMSAQLYDLFLDKDKQYSCAYFRNPDDSLEIAQAQKKAHIAGKLLLQPGMRVLDIGCGWGGMALTLARDHGVEVLGVTLSEEQHKIATARAKAEGLSDKVEFRLADYRTVTENFDRIVSVGMFEHVGVPHYREYFQSVHDRLAENGVALIHTIGRVTPPGYTAPWIQKYIFPGGYIPSMSEVLKAIEKQSLYPTDIEVWRLHYAETLRHWQKRFQANHDRVAALYDERFCRMWRFYLTAAEMTFRHNNQCVFQFQLARRQDAVPLTRDYLYREPDRGEDRLHHAAE